MIEYVNRRGSNCYKWDSDHARGTMPLWVADMDFKAAPAIIEALRKRLEHGVFGYQYVPQQYYDSIASWFGRRHGWKGITRDKIIYTIGVVPAISAVLRALSDKKKETDGADARLRVITLTPAYNCFFSSISNTGCTLLPCRLKETPEEHGQHFEIDWEDFSVKAAETDVFLLCNPHNPTGRVWTADELRHIAEICRQHDIFVISDEIHSEFTFPGVHYTPYATVSLTPSYCICVSASKAFNIAGLQCANIFVPDAGMRARIDKAINIHEVCDISPFGMEAMMAAYNDSQEWIDELQQVIYHNYSMLCGFFRERLPELTVTRMEGTYLAWVNIRALLSADYLRDKTPCRCFSPHSAEEFCSRLAKEEQVLFNHSEMYGAEGYIRINLATSEEILTEAMKRLERFVRNGWGA